MASLSNSKKKKFKFGALSIALTAAVIAVVIGLNVIFSALVDHYHLTLDMTRDEIYDISPLTYSLLDTVKSSFGEDKAKIVFMSEEDRVRSSSDKTLREVYELTKKYEAAFDFIEVDFVNPDLHPERVKQYLRHAENARLEPTDIVFEGPGGQYKILSPNNFLTTDSESGEVIGFSGERRITVTLMSLVSKDAIAYLLTGHGEDTENLGEFRSLLETVGFAVEELDLQTADLDPEKGRLVVINSPKTDLWGVNDPVNEVKKLDSFLDRFGHMMVFVDPRYQDNLPNLQDLLIDWGIKFDSNLVIESDAASLSVDGRTISCTYHTDTELGASLHSSVRALDTVPKTVVSDSSTLTLLEFSSANTHTTRFASPVLETSGGAVAQSLTGESEPVSAAGKPLLAVSMSEQIMDSTTGEAYDNYVLAGGSSDFISDARLRGGYANKDILYSMLRAMVVDNVDTESANISFREYTGEALDITEGEANGNMILISVAIPLVILGVGTVVFVKRRYL